MACKSWPEAPEAWGFHKHNIGYPLQHFQPCDSYAGPWMVNRSLKVAQGSNENWNTVDLLYTFIYMFM